MAEKGAHLTVTINPKPSIFDFVAQQSLDHLLHQSLKRVANFLSLQGERYQIVSNWFNELYFVGHSALQLYYLKKFSATFTENFYSLKRVNLSNPKVELKNRDIVLSVVFSSLVPYLCQKLDEKAERIYHDPLSLESKKWKIIPLKSVIYLNNCINIMARIISFVQYIKYLSGKTDIISPGLWACNLKLEYATEENDVTETLSLRNIIPKLLKSSFELSAFFVQFWNSWHTDRVLDLNALPVPPPPRVHEDAYRHCGRCPICSTVNVKDAATLTVSGFVFCRICITSHIDRYKRCPVTKLPASRSNIIRLYLPGTMYS